MLKHVYVHLHRVTCLSPFIFVCSVKGITLYTLFFLECWDIMIETVCKRLRGYNPSTMYLLALSWVICLPCWSPIFCSGEQIPEAILNGSSITFIPTDMEPAAMTYLWIFNTNIQTLDLRQLLPYTSLSFLKVQSSPVTRVVSANLPNLLGLHLNSLHMAVPPDLGPLSPRLQILGLSDSIITTIPDDYFSNFTRLKEVGLMNLGLTSLRETWMSDLNRARDLYISGNPFVVLPPLQLWFPNLKGLYARSTGVTSIPVALVKAMKSPAVLKLTDNSLTSIPQRDDFEPITKWQQINLKGNPLHCDRMLCWIKVRWRNIKQVILLSIQP